MGHKHTKDEILDGALAVAFADGLSRVTFGRVAKHLGINDRTVVYYFPTKDDLITEIILSLGAELQATLAPAFSSPAGDHLEVTRIAWPILTTPEADRVFALFFEANGLATAGRQPYADLVPQLIEAWAAWIEQLLDGPADTRRDEALAAIAVIDGLLLVRLLAGADGADRAARRLGLA